jgi:hypothetical protein
MFPVTTHCFADVVQIRHAYQNEPLQRGKERDEEIFLFFGVPELAEPRPDTRSNDSGGCSIKAGGDSNPWRAAASRVLVQSPAETVTDLQIICLFAPEKQNALRGALAEINERLKGLPDQIRQPTLFQGELGETLLIESAQEALGQETVAYRVGGSRNVYSAPRGTRWVHRLS